MDDHKEISDEYKKVYETFYLVLLTCNVVSREFADIPSPTSAHYYASLIFTKLCVSGRTVISICPAPDHIGKDAHWDCASVATLTRGIVETYLVLFYLCIEECSSEEWQARWRLFNLHDHMSRFKMFNALKRTDNYEATKFENATPQVKSDLVATEYFKSLSAKQQTHFLKGNNAFFKTQDEIVTSAGGNVHDFRYMYRFLSNHAHTFPVGFYRMVESDRGRGVESETEIGYTSMCLEWAHEYLDLAKAGFYKIWSPHFDLVKEK